MNRRNTYQKAVIQQAIVGEGIHHTAEEVYDIVQTTNPEIGLATVYRNLNLLCEQKEIKKMVINGETVFDGNAKPHDHFYCVCCHSLEDIPSTYDEKMDASIAKKTHKKILRHTTTFEGLCETCLKKEEKNTWN